MIYHSEGLFHIAFGDARHAFNPKEYRHSQTSVSLLETKPFKSINCFMRLDSLIFLHQVHSNHGLSISRKEQIQKAIPFSYDGDFIITNLSSVGLAIATADCLPIILYSPFNGVIGIVHAGWRGSVKKVAIAAIEYMHRMFHVDLMHIKVFFGPSAKRCCYTVGKEVIDQLNQFSFKENVIIAMGTDQYFDVPLFNQLLLEEAGIPRKAFNTSYNYCTICDESFCSYRRDKNEKRQMTIVALK